MAKKAVLTTARRKLYEADARTLNFYRRNPIIAAEDLLGIYLTDSQAWVLESTWNTRKSVWSCTRNWGKSFLISVYCILKAILYPNQKIYIISNVGDQAKETFGKIEEIILRQGRTVESIPDLKDIAIDEIKTDSKVTSGFKHYPSGWSVEFYNGSEIFTLNSKPDNARGKRATLVVYDECAFISEDLIVATEPFITQNADAGYGKDSANQQALRAKQPYNQIIMASTQDDVDRYFYKEFRNLAKQMIAGDKTVFCADLPCTTATKMFMKGREVAPLLTEEVIQAAIKRDPDKARRELNRTISYGVI